MSAFVQDKMDFIRMGTVRAALKLEIAGMTRSRSPSAYMIAKKKYKLKGGRQSVYDQLTELMESEHDKQKEKYHNVRSIRG